MVYWGGGGVVCCRVTFHSSLKGKVVGSFYDKNGTPTELLKKVQAVMEEGQRLQAQKAEKKRQYPPCNSEWSSTGGSRVWCSKQRYDSPVPLTNWARRLGS